MKSRFGLSFNLKFKLLAEQFLLRFKTEYLFNSLILKPISSHKK